MKESGKKMKDELLSWLGTRINVLTKMHEEL